MLDIIQNAWKYSKPFISYRNILETFRKEIKNNLLDPISGIDMYFVDVL